MLNHRIVPSRMLIACVSIFSVGAFGAVSSASQPPKAEAPAKAPSATAEKLEAVAAKYANAKTYQDTGEVKQVFESKDKPRTVTMPFATAFERGGRFAWNFKSSALPGGPADQKYSIWSTDQKRFESYWDITKELEKFDSMDMAIAGPTGVSGGAATVVIPLLLPEMKWGIRTTQLTDAVELEPETIDGVACAVIKGTKAGDAEVTLWLDGSLGIRKVHEVRVVDPSKVKGRDGRTVAGERAPFKVSTTITISPVFDEKINDEKFRR